MALQLSVAVRNAKLDAVETAIGASPTLEIRTGAAPANCAAADSGSVLATLALPADFMAAAASGVKAKSGTYQVAASGTGTAAHYRIKQGGTCHLQGTVTATSGGGDLELDNVSIAAAQSVTITSYQWTEGNA